MILDLLSLVLSLGIILLSCELFTNGVEWLGKQLRLGDGVIASIFSAVGTCLPETIIPIIAILFSGNSSENVDIGIGAIVGAPFMLGTLAFFLTGLSVLLFWRKRKTGLVMNVNNKVLKRDIGFFMLIYTIGLLSSLVSLKPAKYIIAVFLVCCYVYYIIQTVKSDEESQHNLEPLHLTRFIKKKISVLVILVQVAVALTGIIIGAELFVEGISRTSEVFGISALVLSIIVTPIATELPEKFNSILWISKKKDTLALGNISGAMVFQSCIPVAIGIAATSWQLDIKAVVSGIMALLSATVVYLWIRAKGKLNPVPLLTGGLFYIAFIVYMSVSGFK